ncbi:hypothetical protein OAN96_00675 [Candidatus Gracilibacteria bacterium]|nr:hypothetical protein [Candidatus Gracilibacteria bacterium]
MAQQVNFSTLATTYLGGKYDSSTMGIGTQKQRETAIAVSDIFDKTQEDYLNEKRNRMRSRQKRWNIKGSQQVEDNLISSTPESARLDFDRMIELIQPYLYTCNGSSEGPNISDEEYQKMTIRDFLQLVEIPFGKDSHFGFSFQGFSMIRSLPYMFDIEERIQFLDTNIAEYIESL